jgi:hypothetical protein
MLSCDLHEVPGRLRVKVPALRGRPDGDDIVQTLFQDLEGVSNASFNPLTGSIVVHYIPRFTGSAAILKRLNDHQLLPVKKSATSGIREASVTRQIGQYTVRELGRFLMAKTLEHNGLGLLAALI